MPGKSKSDDELARTATAAPDPSSPAMPTPPLGATLGRYRLERELGAGGMGVVHAAFDPDLERRVALKVLLNTGGDEARQRLLREARAMARLTHTNVVTVHEVGSEGGRDYVAMELIEGETLADWLRSTKRSEREIVAAFVAAGRGLAAAHAADLVHRDFKPHNVLRRRDGRIAVTDFGLARGVENVEARALETTMPLAAGATTPNTPSSLSGLTATGSVLGTPAYMAPEQWIGGTVGPPADQFAYCVALWEALTGERPYRGTTIDTLRSEVSRGPAELDASKLPRRLRAVLRRGLDPDPDKRWPSMDALLGALVRKERRTATTILSGAVAVAMVVYYGMIHRTMAPGPSCKPAREIATAWSTAMRKTLEVPDKAGTAAFLDADAARWTVARDRACSATPELQAEQLQCLDGVLERFDALRTAATNVEGKLDGDWVASGLVDPMICITTKPPRFTLHSNSDVVAGLVAGVLADRDQQMADATLGGTDPCARALVLLARLDASIDPVLDREVSQEAISEADRCGDDRLRADVAISVAPVQYEHPVIGEKGEAAIKHAANAIERVSQPDLRAQIDLMRASVASQHERWDEALKLSDSAITEFGTRGRVEGQLTAVSVAIGVRLGRVGPGDPEAILDLVHTWRPRGEAARAMRQVARLDNADGLARFALGDAAGAHEAIVRSWEELRKDAPNVGFGKQQVEGDVVDGKGQPVAGAKVVVARVLIIDSIDILFPFLAPQTVRMVQTDPQGHFVIPDSPDEGGVIAELDTQRSLPERIAAHVRLVLAPTRRITGTVELGSVSPTRVAVSVQPAHRPIPVYEIMTPVDHAGAFVIDGAPSVPIEVAASVGNLKVASAANVTTQRFPAGRAAIANLKLSVTHSNRQLSVLVRSTLSTPIESARVAVIDGKIEAKTTAELMDRSKIDKGVIQQQFARVITGEQVPKQLIGRYQAGDLVSEFDNVATNEVSVCVIPFPGDIYDPKVGKQINAHLRDLDVKCIVVPPNVSVITVDTPPQRRLD